MNAPFRSTLAAGIDAWIGIVRFRKGPEDVPASTALLVLVLAAGALLRGAAVALLPSSDGPAPAVVIGLGMGLSLGFIWVVVQVAGRPERFVQTATALFGAEIVVMPALLVSSWFYLAHANDPVWQLPAAMLQLAVQVWVLLIAARIIRSATGWSMFACIGLTIIVAVLTLLVLSAVMPAPAPEAPPPA